MALDMQSLMREKDRQRKEKKAAVKRKARLAKLSASLPDKWKMRWSSKEKRDYYYNEDTGKTYWREDGCEIGWGFKWDHKTGRKVSPTFPVVTIAPPSTFKALHTRDVGDTYIQ